MVFTGEKRTLKDLAEKVRALKQKVSGAETATNDLRATFERIDEKLGDISRRLGELEKKKGIA